MIDKSNFKWMNGQKAAVTLSYDDALPVHYEGVAPVLEKAGIRGTFNLPLQGIESGEPWKKLAENGHELGNHTIFHPCRKSPKGDDSWLPDEYDLCKYTPRRWVDEVKTANTMLSLIDGKGERTFANTCCNNHIGSDDSKTCLEELIPGLFVAARGEFTGKPVDVSNVNYNACGHTGADGRSFESVKGEIEGIMEQGNWIIYMIHGVGKDTHNLYMETEEHNKLIEWLGANSQDIWTATMMEVAKYLKQFYHA